MSEPNRVMDYVVYTYEVDRHDGSGFWHIYETDFAPENVSFGGVSILTIRAPESDRDLEEKVKAVTAALNAATEAGKPYEALGE